MARGETRSGDRRFNRRSSSHQGVGRADFAACLNLRTSTASREFTSSLSQAGSRWQAFGFPSDRGGDERIGPAVPAVESLVDEIVGLRSLLDDGTDGSLEDLPRSSRHGRILVGPSQ